MILVTGGTGLVGAHLLLQLAESGTRVRSLYRSSQNLARTKNLFTHFGKAELFEHIEWVQGDILDLPSLEEAFKGIDYVYHCAGYISFDPGDEEKLRKINIQGTANMVNCALDFGIKKFCHVSSVAALGDSRPGEAITEETEWNPEVSHSDYALSKHGGEMEVWRAWQEGLDVVIVNPGIIFGYGFWDQGSGLMFRSVKNGQYFYTKGTCGFVAVADVVKIMVQLMQSGISGEGFTIVAQNLSYKDIFDTIADGMGKKRPTIYATPGLTSIAWKIDWLLSKLFLKKRTFTKAMAVSAHAAETYDNSKVIGALNYNFTDWELHLKELARSQSSPSL